jgi:hypothetical protein
MGSLRGKSRLSDSAICAEYRNGASRDLLSMRSGLHDGLVVEVLRRNGIPLRDDAEAAAIAVRSRARHKSTLRMVKRLRRPCHSAS